MKAADLSNDDLKRLLRGEAAGDLSATEAMWQLRWQLGANPYQYEPCLRCRWHEHWRMLRDEVGHTTGCTCASDLTPDHDYGLWMFQSGRGVGKTWTGSHWAVRQALKYPGSYGGVIAPTHSNLRNTLLEGPTGIIRAVPRHLIQLTRDAKVWNMGAGQITFKNGSVLRTLSAEMPDRIRGENFNWVWADEMAAWTRLDYAWEQLEMATRQGLPKFLVTTTPRPLPILKYLLAEEGTVVTRASTKDNVKLPKRFLDSMERKYAGTRIGRQELEGELIDDVDGALWTWALVEQARLTGSDRIPDAMERIVVAIDPSGGGAAEIGIIVMGLHRGTGYVLADYTKRGTPNEWASAAIEAYDLFQADRIIGERNYGGDMVEAVIRGVRSNVPYSDVTASRGKQLRAEPVVNLYERGLIKHAQDFEELERQLTGWVPNMGMPSPDRLDAMVWAATFLMLGDETGGTSLADLLVSPSGVSRTSPWRL